MSRGWLLFCVLCAPACFASHEAGDASAPLDAGVAPDLAPPVDLGRDLGSPDLGPPPDMGYDAGPTVCTPDSTLGSRCGVDADCDDGCFCTVAAVCTGGRCARGTERVCPEDTVCSVTTCNEATDMCEGTRNDAICDDHEFCNGLEWCLPFGGCRPGVPPACDDGNACTVDCCTHGGVGCGHSDCDDDGDGFGPRDCMGTDCNDFDPTIHPGAVDICDGVDNDCAQDWDYDVPGCTTGFDTCASAGEIDPTVVVAYYFGTTLANGDDYTLSCGPGGADAVYHLNNPVARLYEFQIDFVGTHVPDVMMPEAIAVRPWASCAAGPDRRCAMGPTWGGPFIGWHPSAVMPIMLPAGEWAIIVEAETATSYSLRVSW